MLYMFHHLFENVNLFLLLEIIIIIIIRWTIRCSICEEGPHWRHLRRLQAVPARHQAHGCPWIQERPQEREDRVSSVWRIKMRYLRSSKVNLTILYLIHESYIRLSENHSPYLTSSCLVLSFLFPVTMIHITIIELCVRF